MAVKSGFFMSVNGDRRYDASFFAEYFSSFIGNGIFPNPSTNLQVVEDNNMQTVVKPGKGWINGYYVHNDSDFILQHDVADGVLKRIDRIVLQWNYLTRQIEIVLKKGVFASSPVAPALVRNTDYYELALADVLISNGITRITQAAITDQRLNSALCGIVTQTVKTVDTTTLFNQYQSWINQQKALYTQELESWTTEQRQSFEEWMATQHGDLEAWRQLREQEFVDWMSSQQTSFNNWMQQEQTEFESWYQSLQDLLDENIAATLTLKVKLLEEETSEIKQGFNTHLTKKASLTEEGHVQLTSAVNSESEGLAATPKAVKLAYDLAQQAKMDGNSRKNETVDALLQIDDSLPITQTSSWSDIITQISNVSTGKKWASGMVTSSTSTKIAVYSGNASYSSNLYSVTVSGLAFKPTLILVNAVTPYNNYEFNAIYKENNFSNYHHPSVKLFTNYYYNGNLTEGGTYRIDGTSFYVRNGSFILPIGLGNARNREYYWVAIE